jgi:segregation and condensation protein B
MSDVVSTPEERQGNNGVLTENMRVLEALLFATDEVLTVAALKELLPGAPDTRTVRKLVMELNAELQRQRHPFEVVELGGGYQFRTVPYYRPWVGKLLKEKTARRLSVQALECLAIIAYRQPISKAEIEGIRGVISDGAMKTLMERRMVDIVGRSDKPGRPLLYGTSKEFLEYFGINKLSDLPRIEEFEAMAREKMEQLTEEERVMIEAAPDESEAPAQPHGEIVSGNEPETVGPEAADQDPADIADQDIDADGSPPSTEAEHGEGQGDVDAEPASENEPTPAA